MQERWNAAPLPPTARRVLAGAALLLAASLGAGGAQAASASPRERIFVSPIGRATKPGRSCATARFSSIMAAIGAAPAGSTVVVCPGTYAGQVTVIKPITLEGEHARIDAAGADTGITVPTPGVTVEGFTVTGAIGEGILVVGRPGVPVTHVTVRDNVVVGNDRGNPTGAPISSSAYRECNATGKVPGDCGEGIHLMVAADSTVVGNTVEHNSGGILVTDEFGPADHNLIKGNLVKDNVLDCGITLPSHSAKAYVGGKLDPAAGGVYDNIVEDNRLIGNGTRGQGAGILLAAALPGGASYDNVVRGNTIIGSGLSGVTVHLHAPGQYLSGNVVEGNTIRVNNLLGDPDFTPTDHATTGVLVGTVAPLAIRIAHNTIVGDAYGIWYLHPAVVAGAGTNTFRGVRVHVHAA
ncbi:MAG TPA: right-handed parallel beta-helix repeat-containing protein [Acidimicrobiales bacterium]|nr:right-handed parallel beta-helix repeat-containing protein [Acidimicrobiales bacterium]